MSVWEAVIGLEVHARLMTQSKAFCACSTAFGAPPNSQTCPVCLGYPGALPVLNRTAVDLALRMAVAARATIHRDSRFARKNYFYPDLPKGYQISQYDRPLATGGRIVIHLESETREIGLTRIHLEEDAGKLLHDVPWDDVPKTASLVDLNRAGVPLIEIVSEPVIRSSAEAIAYLTRLRQTLMYGGVCDGNMEEGSLRCDANISVRRTGDALGTRAEVKNLNSFRFLGRAIDFEIERQIAVIEGGGRIVQETRLFDAASGETRAMRSKEEAHDYRYFPEPDLEPLVVDDAMLAEAASALPEMPDARVERYVREFNLPPDEAEVLVASREVADYFEATAERVSRPRSAANWVRNEVMGFLNARKVELDAYPVRPEQLAALIELLDRGVIGGKAAKDVFEEMSTSGNDPGAIVEQHGLAQVSDPAAIREVARRVVDANPGEVAKYRGGRAQVFGFFVGRVMKEMQGRANAEVANAVLHELLDTDAESPDTKRA
ncbi:MAG: Asp-tRNA(Asn)/Glu-tRNA(Gln) amidotransferase subunit GatB [Thermoanaerobaculia bacterium]